MIARIAIVYGYSIEGATILALLYGPRGTLLVSGFAIALGDLPKLTLVGYVAGEAYRIGCCRNCRRSGRNC